MLCIRKMVFCCLALILLYGVVNAQYITYHFDNYSLKDRLPSSEVYAVFRDSKNYLWFATDHGICRYDGYSFKTIILPDNTVFQIRQDDEGRIWLATYTSQLFYIEDDKVYPYKYNGLILGKFQNQLISDFQLGPDNSVYISFMVAGYVKIDPLGKITTKMSDKVQFGVEQIGEVFFTSVCNGGKKTSMPIPVNVTTSSYSHTTEIKNTSTLWIRKSRAFRSISGDIIACAGNYFLVINKENGIYTQQLPFEILSIMEDTDGDLWVGGKYGGISLLSKNNGQGYIVRENHLEGLSVTGVVQDHEGGFWFTTLEKGVFYLRSKYLRLLSPGKQLRHGMSSLAVINDSLLLMGTIGKGIYQYDPRKNLLRSMDLPGNFSHIYFDDETREAITLGSEFGDSSAVLAFKRKFHAIQVLMTDGSSNCLKLGRGKYLLGRYDGVYVLDTKTLSVEKLNKAVFRATYLLKDTDESILIANQYGLWKFKENSFIPYDTSNVHLKRRITCMVFFHGRTLCMGTRGDGLLIKTGDSIHRITEEQGLVNNNIKKIIVTGNDIVAVTNKGLSKIKVTSREPFQYSISNLGYSEGLFVTEVYDACMLNGILYIASDIGLGFVDASREFSDQRSQHLPFHFSYVKINDRPVLRQSAYTLPHSQRDITIAYTALSFRDPLGTQYRYRIMGIDTNWIYTMAREIRLTSMPYGNYTIEFQAIAKSANWSSAIASIGFSIQPPFWKTRWFIALAALFVVGFLYLWAKTKVDVIKRREEEKTLYNKQIAEMEIRALRAQMNPHFTFNVMQSIQYYISHHDFGAARKYLSKFSKLMRTILDNSRFAYIALFDEIGTLQDYLDLEKLRFEETFEYSIHIEPGLDLHAIRVPTMLIQPYVENAIKHGLSSKTSNARVDISITRKDGYLVCEISDNGIGREKAAELAHMRPEKHIPVGTSLVAERIQAFNKYYGYKLTSETFDLYDDDNHVAGTKVVLTIPLIFHSHDKSIIGGRRREKPERPEDAA